MSEAQQHYFIQTYGCQMNEHDSEMLAALLEESGYTSTTQVEEAYVILVNTCCIREKAESKVLSLLGDFRKYVERKPELIIGVAGCMVQQQDIIPKIRHAAPFVKLFMGTNDMPNLPEHLRYIKETGLPVHEITLDDSDPAVQFEARRKYPFKAYVNIIYGCNNFCSYCIVPYVRGRERSRTIDDIVEEVRRLIADGVVEITVLGQNVNSYGNDLADGTTFTQLMLALDALPGIQRIRFMTSHPKDLSDAFIQAVGASKHICHYFHLPVQSGSDRILQKMNRKYDRARYLYLIDCIRTHVPDAAITTDIIVGFPGETEEDFQDTVSLVEAARFDNAFSFVYSKREGTKAADMIDEAIPLTDKKDRLQRLNQVLSKWSLINNEKYQDQTVNVLVEGVSKNNEKILEGRTDTGKTVLFEGDASLIGTFIDVHVTHVQTWVLKGTIQ